MDNYASYIISKPDYSKMDKVQVALDFIMLYKSHKKGAFYVPMRKQEESHLKNNVRVEEEYKKC